MSHTKFMLVGAAALAALIMRPAASSAQQAQGAVITGVVTDSGSGRPLSNVTVTVLGTDLIGSTGSEGRYTIARVPAGSYTVQFRRLGYGLRSTPEVAVAANARVQLDVTMRPSALQLEAVVTTGVVDPTAGTRVPFTVGRVEAADAPVPATNALETIQGKLSGVSVVPSGQPGSGTNILLRTPTSINKSNGPLVVVDGVILTQSFDASSADLDGLDIESIEVVKGAAAASLYGSRAANGVIQIRTRRGADVADGRTVVSARSEIGSNSLAGRLDWAQLHFYQTNAEGEYLNAGGVLEPCTSLSPEECSARRRATRVPRPAYERFQDTPYRDQVYDQVDRFFNPGQFFKNSVNIAQNTERTNWFLSLANSREEGVVLGNGAYSQNDVRLNLDHRPRSNLSIGFSGYHSRADRDELYADTFFDLINQAPDVDLRTPDPDGTPFLFQGDPEGREENPLYVLSTEEDRTRRARTLGSLEARFTPLGWLSFDSNISYDRSDRRGNFFLDRGVKTEGFAATGGLGEIEQFTGTTNTINAAAGANLIGRRGPLTLRTTLRGVIEREDDETTTASGANFATPGVRSLNNAQERQISSLATEIRADGYFLTAGADYDGRYILDGLVRRDGSSLFGPEERWNTYYRVSGAYRLAEEQWWPWQSFNEFKLRASRGTAGGRPSFADQFETYNFTAGGGVVKQSLGNRFLKPELATETELGLDMILLDRYSLQLSYARSRVEDQLIQIPLAGLYGYTSQWQNAGTVEGNTVEATIEAQLVRRPTVTWRLGLVADRSRSRITEFDRSCFQTQTIAFRCAGETLGAMYGFTFLKSGAQLPDDAAARASEFQVNDEGLLVWVGPGNAYTEGEAKRLWGTTATIGTTNYAWGQPITLRDETGNSVVGKIGDANPDFRFGVSNNVTWRDLSLFVLFDAQVGGNAYNLTNQRMYQYGRSGDVDQAGKTQELKKPVEYYVNLYSANSIVDYFVEDGGYVKLREFALGYRVPPRWVQPLSRTGVSAVRLSLIGRNLLTFTDYSGYDPEVGNTLTRLDSFDYPRYRTFTGSVEITF